MFTLTLIFFYDLLMRIRCLYWHVQLTFLLTVTEDLSRNVLFCPMPCFDPFLIFLDLLPFSLLCLPASFPVATCTLRLCKNCLSWWSDFIVVCLQSVCCYFVFVNCFVLPMCVQNHRALRQWRSHVRIQWFAVLVRWSLLPACRWLSLTSCSVCYARLNVLLVYGQFTNMPVTSMPADWYKDNPLLISS